MKDLESTVSTCHGMAGDEGVGTIESRRTSELTEPGSWRRPTQVVVSKSRKDPVPDAFAHPAAEALPDRVPPAESPDLPNHRKAARDGRLSPAETPGSLAMSIASPCPPYTRRDCNRSPP